MSDAQTGAQRLDEAKKKCYNAANTILVGAALIATITYATWILLPLTNVTDHKAVKTFWVCNSLSFYSAIFTVYLCVVTVWPYDAEIFGSEDFPPLKFRLKCATGVFGLSYCCVLAAYSSGAYVTVPKHVRFLVCDGYILGTLVVGVVPSAVGIIISLVRVYGGVGR
ncbi:hypothetical protein CY35_16G060700 [Sphagnum magellanicum]|nr:hypothetical protein CY35_16G060700 [Sphagnum magellanicum]